MTESRASSARNRHSAAILATLAFAVLWLNSDPSISNALAFWARPNVAVDAASPLAVMPTAPAVQPFDENQLLAELPYGAFIADAARANEIDGWLLAALVETESGFRHRAVSGRGAVGLTQILPRTALAFGSTEADLTDPRSNLGAGAAYLAHLLEEFDGDLGLALAAYNAGPNAVKRFGGIPPFTETREFVERVLGSYLDYRRQAGEAAAAAQV
ncbi:MAG: lytic transglycosylase domain-containing protein [Thermoanaerobaculia bacterium]|nr:lytic transglycosylase domain-containing protein [Thermoanaerobaculia bacterium]